MIRTLFISSTLIGLSIAGGLGLSQAHSTAMGFGAMGGNVTVSSYRDLPRVETERTSALAMPKADRAAPTANAPRLVVQAPGRLPAVDRDGFDAAAQDNGSQIVAASKRPLARAGSETTVAEAAAPAVSGKRVTTSTQGVKPRPVYVAPATYAMVKPVDVPALPVDTPKFLVGVYR